MIRLARTAAFALIIAAPSIQYGASRAEARCVAILRDVVPAAERAPAVVEVEREAVRDTLVAIGRETWEVAP